MIEYAIVSAGAFFRLFNENLYVLQGFYRNFELYLSQQEAFVITAAIICFIVVLLFYWLLKK